MKMYYLLICILFLSACGIKNFIGLESQMHYMKVESDKSMLSLSPGFLTINFGFRSYIYYGSWNCSLIGRWHFSGDTLVLEPQYQINMNTKNDSIDVDHLWTTKKHNEVVNAKPMKGLFKGKDLYILPNDEPFIVEDENGNRLTFPPEWHSPGNDKPMKFVVWRKTTRGDPFKNIRRNRPGSNSQ